MTNEILTRIILDAKTEAKSQCRVVAGALEQEMAAMKESERAIAVRHTKPNLIRGLVCAFAIFVTGSIATAGELTIKRVFGPETPTGAYKHPASMTELKNGDLYLVYYGGAGEYAVETSV